MLTGFHWNSMSGWFAFAPSVGEFRPGAPGGEMLGPVGRSTYCSTAGWIGTQGSSPPCVPGTRSRCRSKGTKIDDTVVTVVDQRLLARWGRS